ncbi:MAG: mechanosensitive ion channel family protein [Litoreibacter sp.]|nr:mechanosensitive ion channel family protein [Litoreibacter sp.]
MRCTLRLLIVFCLCAITSMGMVPDRLEAQTGTAGTQDAQAPDYTAWERTAERARDVIDADRASLEAMETLRSTLVEWRDQFQARQSVNASQIDLVRSQIEALGPAPEGDGAEPTEITERRAELNTELNALLAPVLRAQDAFTLADGLVKKLDSTLRDRRAQQILRLDPSPLNPAHWPAAGSALGAVSGALSHEVAENYASDLQRSRAKDKLPLIGVLVVVGLILLTRSPRWVERLMMRIRANGADSNALIRVGTFVASLFSVLIPALGIFAILRAVDFSGLTGPVGDLVLHSLTVLVAVLLGARWLSRQVFAPVYPPGAMFDLTQGQLREARLYGVALSVLVALSFSIETLRAARLLSDVLTLEVRSVLLFPISALAGVMLFRLGQILIAGVRHDGDEMEEQWITSGAAGRILWFLSRASLIIAVAGPVLAAIGYATAGSFLINGMVETLALMGLVVVLQRLGRDIYAIFRGDVAAREGLFPVLVGFALSVLALPGLALIWGASISDLGETWVLISAGVPLGETRITPANVLTFAVIFVIGYTLTRMVQNTLKTQVLPKTKIDVGGRNALVVGTGYVGFFIAALVAITSAGIDLSSLAIVAGALSVGIGFGLQTIVSNFVSGIILLIERPISEGDWIEVGTDMGVVKDISVRATRIETFDRRDVIIPNADLIAGSVTNWTKGNLNGRIILGVGVAYGTDTRKVEAILREIVEATPGIVLSPPPAVLFTGFGADSLDFEIRAILRDVNYSLSIKSDINHAIAERFKKEGIEIPYAQRDVWLRNPEILTGVQALAGGHEDDPSDDDAQDDPAATSQDQ